MGNSKASQLKRRRREKALELIREGKKRYQIRFLLAEEFGVSPRTAKLDIDEAYDAHYDIMKLRAEQMRVATAMYMGNFRKGRIVDALVENWGKGGPEVGCEVLSEEEAERLVLAAKEQVDDETPKTKEGKRERLALWFEDKMMNAARDRDKIRSAALYMRLEGLADTSEYEPQRDDIVIELGDWRSQYARQMADGVASAGPPQIEIVPAGEGEPAAPGGNGSNGNGNGSNGNGDHP